MNVETLSSQKKNKKDAAVFDAFYFLNDDEVQYFLAWAEQNHLAKEDIVRVFDFPVRVLKYEGWQLAKAERPGGIEPQLRGAIQEWLLQRESGLQRHIILVGANLVVFHETNDTGASGLIAVLSPDSFLAFLRMTFPAARITPALQRLLTCYVAGLSLTEISVLDGKSTDTIKSQTRELKLRTGLKQTADIGRITGARLLMALGKASNSDIAERNLTFDRYVERYLPETVRTMTMLGKTGEFYRFLDMGPKGGVPLICLHPLILSDIRPEDLDVLDELNLRLVWPLRNGLLAPSDPALSEADHLRHACLGIDLARRIFCDDKVAILSFNASSRVALAYTKNNPGEVTALFFAGVCISNPLPSSHIRRLIGGMIALAGRDHPMMGAVLEYFCQFIFTRARMTKFLRRHFQNRAADWRIIESELFGRFGSDRIRDGLTNSIQSAKHDFGFQRVLDWKVASSLNIDMHFIHGSADVLHPPPLAASVAAGVPGSTFHLLKGAGDLLYHNHLKSVLRLAASHLLQ